MICCFHVLDIVNNTVINIDMQVSLCVLGLNSLTIYLRVYMCIYCVLTSFAASNNQCLCMNLTHIYFMYYTFFTLIGLRFYRSLDFTPWKLMSWSVSLVLKEPESCYDISKGRNQGGFCTSWFHVATVLWGLLPFLSQCL